jgi:hypothetical protein
MKPFPFIGPAYTARSPNYASSRCVNLYLEGGKGKAPALLIGTPGLSAPWITLATSGVRGMRVVDDTTAIMVAGGVVYKVTSGAVATVLGSVPDDGKTAHITSDGTNFVVTSGGNLYSFTLTGAATTLIYSGVSDVDYIDDRFIATLTDTGNYIWSDVVTTIFNPLSIQATNGTPDKLIGVRVSRRTIYFFGSQSLEQWYDAGGADNPFSRIDGGFFEIGCAARDSIAEMDGVFWLGSDDKGAGSVWTVTGGAPKRISTPAIEYAIAQWPDLSDAYAFTYTQETHAFYVLTSVSGNETWVYDISVGEWHQRAWLHSSGEFHRIRPRCHAYFAGAHLVGDWQTGDVYQYDLDTYSDNGNPLPALRACSTVQDGLNLQRNMSFRLDMDSGVGLTTGQGSNPQAMLRFSDDGGKTWSSSLWRTFGRIGEYARRCIWHRIGGGERSVIEITITDPVPRRITGAYFT